VRVLFISYYLPPLLYPQSIQIGRFLYYLKKYNDLDIVVVTADEIGSRIDKELYSDIFDGIEILKIKSKFNIYLNYIKNRFLPFFYQRPDIYLKWMNIACKEIIQKYKKFDVILTFSYPLSTNILGAKLKNYYKCKWVAHNSDPWADNPHLHIPSYLKNYHQKLEKETFNKADKLLFTSLETAEFYKNKYPNLNIDYINHSFDSYLYPNIKEKNEKFTFRYIGSFYGTRTPKPLFEALKILSKEKLAKFNVEIIGGGKKAKILLKQYNLENVKVLSPVSYIESLELMKKSDCLLVIDAPSKDKSIFFPSKLADYIGAQKPIFGISPEGCSNRILKELGYICYNTSQIENIAKEIENIIIYGYEKSDKVNYIKQYDITENIKKLKGIIDE
jgi:hypothetical protein